MLRNNFRAQENHGNVVRVHVMKDGVIVNVHFAERGLEFSDEWQYLIFSLFAQVAAFARVQRYLVWIHNRKPPIFGALVEIALLALSEQSILDHCPNAIEDRLACSRRIPANKLEKRVQVERLA